jgi:hypothetical protein
VVEWVCSFVIGVYVGILLDPWFRAWVTQNEWARQARDLEEQDSSQSVSGQISLSDHEWLANQPVDPPSESADEQA